MEINGTEVSEIAFFKDMNLSEPVMKALEKKGYEQATAVQAGAIRPLMEWQDMVAKAPTGTGKTFAFGIPMVEHIDPESEAVQALILAPTRELAIQIREELQDLCAFMEGVRTVVLYGGQPIDKQIKQLKAKPQIVIATPGRLKDHMQRRTVKLDKVQTVVLDEADRMLDMGFVKDVRAILDKIKSRKNLAMFSATISREVLDISWIYQRDPVEITVRPTEENRPDIRQLRIDFVEHSQKSLAIVHLMRHEKLERAIAFCNTKMMTDRLTIELQRHGLRCEGIHGDIKQALREQTLKRFRDGKIEVLVATDVAARGLDIDDVDAVFNFDVPDENEYYIHRIGRTGRAKKHGIAYNLVYGFAEIVRLEQIAKHPAVELETMEFTETGDLRPVEK
jgi:Superfamily II DNA and RNA helicases